MGDVMAHVFARSLGLAQAGVIGDVPAGGVFSGYPARPHKEALRASAGTFRLAEILLRLTRLERRLEGEGE